MHAKAQVTTGDEQHWRQPLTSRMLAPGEGVSYGFLFEPVSSYAEAKRALVQRGLLGIDVSPGMVVPADLEGLGALHSKHGISSLRVEFPSETRIERLPGEARDG